jgi:zinc protease
VLLNATMPEKAVAREKEVQIAGIRQENEELTTVARNILREALFPQHPFSLRARGSVESVSKLTPADLLRFRDEYLVAKNGVISVFGNVKAAEVKQVFEQALGKMRSGEIALAHPPQPSPFLQSKEVQSIKDKTQAVLMVGYRGVDMYSPDRYALELIDEASSDLASRFFIRIREQMGLAYYVGASQVQGLVPGLFVFYLGTDPAKLPPVKAALLDEINKLATNGLTEEELNRAKKKLIGQQQIGNQSNDAFGYMTALDELYGLGYNHYKEVEAKINAVSMADVRRVAASYFQNKPFVLATVRPPEKRVDAK